MVVTLFLFFFMRLFAEIGGRQDGCKESRCSAHGPVIRFPFRLKHQPNHCGYPGFEISCSEEKRTMLELPYSVKLSVQKINYTSQEIWVSGRDFCKNFNLSASHSKSKADPYKNLNPTHCGFLPNNLVYGVSPEASLSHLDLSSCSMIYYFSIPCWSVDLGEYSEYNVVMNWSRPACGDCEAKGKRCRLQESNIKEPEIECVDQPPKDVSKEWTITGVILGFFLLLLVVIICYNHSKKLQKFLEDYRALNPSRYSYADIKKITNLFKDKLGEGGYGTVYKGKLSNEVFVAVKILNDSKENGEEFINEVRTMGRIHHINVVRLVGFCADGYKRALIYEFLPNESLEKFIFKNQSLGWQKLHDIALGIAKGIEYLHQGCDQRILHFDIKPHNILLDQNFNPKISDFGLAKLCSKEQSVVSMTAARGTMGYIAPEVLSRNFGNVSYKSDVYSFGMLLLEMVGGRKNSDAIMENTSQMYFPEWLYNHLEQKGEVHIRIEKEEDTKIAKRLSIVGLWCIQWHPIDRPSMKIVIKMLEGEDNITRLPILLPLRVQLEQMLDDEEHLSNKS
ncbi:hypothetical protein AAG906_012878 [Vitis piasezkii]